MASDVPGWVGALWSGEGGLRACLCMADLGIGDWATQGC